MLAIEKIQQRRIMLFVKACHRVSLLREQGRNLQPAIEAVAKQYNGHSLGNGITFKCSKTTLKRYWYASCAGTKPGAFKDRRLTRLSLHTVPRELVRALNIYTLQHGFSCREAFKALGGKDKLGFSYTRFCRVIQSPIKKAALQRKLANKIFEDLKAQLLRENTAAGSGGGNDRDPCRICNVMKKDRDQAGA